MGKRTHTAKPADLEHILYEIEMLLWAYIHHTDKGHPSLHNMHLECIVIHARNLTEFLLKPGGGDHGGWAAKDFVPHFVPDSTKYSEDLFDKMCEEVTHISRKRKPPDQREHWNLPKITTTLLVESITFLREIMLVPTFHAHNDRVTGLVTEIGDHLRSQSKWEHLDKNWEATDVRYTSPPNGPSTTASPVMDGYTLSKSDPPQFS